MAEPTPITRKRGRPPKSSELERRTASAMERVKNDAQKIALAEMVVERLDEIVALLRGAGFKVSRSQQEADAFHAGVKRAAEIMTPPPTVQHPCKLCGREGVRQDYTGSWLCLPHAGYEAANNAIDPDVKGMVTSPAPMRIRATKPPPPEGLPPPAGKMLIQPVAEDFAASQRPAGVANGPRVTVLDDGDDGAEALN